MDAHLIENSVVQENQRHRISALKQAIQKVSKIIDKIKPGKVTQTGKRETKS